MTKPAQRKPPIEKSLTDPNKLLVAQDTNGLVHIKTAADWFYLTPEQAVELARKIAAHAGATKVEIEL